jgi:hypothetical protein
MDRGRIALCVVGALLLLAALVVGLEVPATYTITSGGVGQSNRTNVVSHDTTAIIWFVALAVVGIVAIATSILFPRRRTGAPVSQTELGLRGEIGELRGEVGGLRKELHDLRDVVRDSFTRVAEAIEQINNHLDKHD